MTNSRVEKSLGRVVAHQRNSRDASSTPAPEVVTSRSGASISPMWTVTTIVILGCLVSLVGCNSRAPSREANRASIGQLNAIDAGVIFVDENNYLCVPFSRIGIDESTRVTSVSSSCECTRPSIVVYQESASKVARGLRVDFVDDAVAGVDKQTTLPLAVVIKLQLDTGHMVSTTIEFLYTRRDDGEGS
jgi:hypothetical protein